MSTMGDGLLGCVLLNQLKQYVELSETGEKKSGIRDDVVKIADILRGFVVKIRIQKNTKKLPGNENKYGNQVMEVAETINNEWLQLKMGYFRGLDHSTRKSKSTVVE